MLRKTSRGLLKNVLSFTKVKLLYTRITLTRYTAVFFWAALINFIIGVVFQGISLQDHLNADSVVSTIFREAGLSESSLGLPLLTGDNISVCDGIPGNKGVDCNILDLKRFSSPPSSLHARSSTDCHLSNKRDNASKTCAVYDDSGHLLGVTLDGTSLLDPPCITSFVWLAEMLRDAKREDIATLTFQIWLLTLAVVTILNESLPHLGTVLVGHVLLTAWAGFRIHESFRLKDIYENGIVNGPCNQYDPMGGWWDVRLSHAIPMVVMNGVALLVMGGLSFKLFKVYAKETFSRVGATAEIHHLYKLVLFLSVCLQLTGFFVLVSAAIWIDKIAYGSLRQFVSHFGIYVAAFVVTAVFTIPWLVLGWTCVRREYRRGLYAFIALSFIMLSIAIAMFTSPTYRFVFNRWPFFATLAVTAFVLMMATALIGVICGRNFGQGLAQYLNVTDALEGEDFTPVMFSTSDSEKGSLYDEKKGYEIDSFTSRPTRKSSLFTPRSTRPLSSVFTGSQTRIVSPTPVFLRDVDSQPLSPLSHSRKNSAPSPRTLRKNSVHRRGISDQDRAYDIPTLSYQSNQPSGRPIELKRSNTNSSTISGKSVVSEFPPVLPPVPVMAPLTRPKPAVKVGLPSNPRSRAPSPTTSRSPVTPAEGKPGYF